MRDPVSDTTTASCVLDSREQPLLSHQPPHSPHPARLADMSGEAGSEPRSTGLSSTDTLPHLLPPSGDLALLQAVSSFSQAGDETRSRSPYSFLDDVAPGTFVTAKGTTLPAPSAQEMDAAKAKMEEWERGEEHSLSLASRAETRPEHMDVNKSISKVLPASSTGRVGSPDTHPLVPPARASPGALRTISNPVYQRSSIVAGAALMSTPARAVSTTMIHSRKRPATPLAATTRSPAMRVRHIAKTSSRALSGTSMVDPTYSATPGARRRGFKTPFKAGPRPPAGSQYSTPQPLYPIASPIQLACPSADDTSFSFGTPSRQTIYPVRAVLPTQVPASPGSTSCSSAPLFDLDVRHAPARKGLLEYGFDPESVSRSEAARRGCPAEALMVLEKPWTAHDFEFLSLGGAAFGPEQAEALLRDLGAAHLTPRWVQHHWGMILWKLAAMARHEPSRASAWWSKEETVRQLRYRYEREVNQGQRPAINRIKQHDSSAAQPMVLCVYRLEYGPSEAPTNSNTNSNSNTNTDTTGDETELREDREGTVDILQPSIVLTDGWYTIRANLDETLYDALVRRRITVGQKLALFGAKCEGGPVEALEADTVTLHLHANGVHHAPWDSKLGFRPAPWVSSLRSLSPEGGKVGMMRIRVTRVFDMGYLDSRAAKGSVHSASEETEHQARWEKDRADAREQLEQEWSDRLMRAQDVVQAIRMELEVEQGHGKGEEVASEGEDVVLDQLFSASEPVLALHRFCPGGRRVTPSLLRAAQARAEVQQQDALHEMQTELDERVPPRRVRTFRVIKLEDAIPPVPRDTPAGRAGTWVRQARKARACPRTAQMTVWNAAELEGIIRVGATFLVSNVVPSAPGSWRAPDEDAEIFLQTRQGSQWIPIPDPDPQ